MDRKNKCSSDMNKFFIYCTCAQTQRMRTVVIKFQKFYFI